MEERPRYIATVTSKGQLTIPADLRRDLGLRQGDRIEFAREEAGVYTVRRVVDKAAIDRAIETWRGRMQPAGRSGAEIVEELRGPLDDVQSQRDRRGS